MKHFFLILAAGCLSACATLSAPPHHAKFLNNDGATLKGASVLKTASLKDTPCRFVFLFPDTPYFSKALFDKKSRISKKDMIYVRKASCAPNGSFVFSDLPEERWTVLSVHPVSHSGEHYSRARKNVTWEYSLRNARTRSGVEDEIYFP